MCLVIMRRRDRECVRCEEDRIDFRVTTFTILGRRKIIDHHTDVDHMHEIHGANPF